MEEEEVEGIMEVDMEDDNGIMEISMDLHQDSTSSCGPDRPDPLSRDAYMVLRRKKVHMPKFRDAYTPLFQEIREEKRNELNELLKNVEEMKKESEEHVELQNKIAEHTRLLEMLRREYAEVEEKQKQEERAMAQRKKDVDKALRKCEVRVKSVESNHKALKAEFQNSKTKLSNAIENRDALDSLLGTLPVQFLVCNVEANRGASDGKRKRVSLGSDSSTEILVEIRNINPNNPEQKFIIRMASMNLETGQFIAENIHPTFEEAYEVIKEANTTQDFMKLLVDCKMNWLKELGLNSPTANQQLIVENGVAETTHALFDSPPQ